MKLIDRIKESIAETLFAKELDDAYNMGTREGYRVGSNEHRKHYHRYVIKQLEDLRDKGGKSHAHGLELALTFLNAIEKGTIHQEEESTNG
jgi:hypothetical protein